MDTQFRDDQRRIAAATATPSDSSRASKVQAKLQPPQQPALDTQPLNDQPPLLPGVYTALSAHSPTGTGTGTGSSAFAPASAAEDPGAPPPRPTSPVSFPLTGPLSGANSTRTSYRSLLDTADAAQIDAAAAAAFAQQPAVPEDDVLPLLEGVPVTPQPQPQQPAAVAAVAAPPPPSAPPSQQQQQQPPLYGVYDPSGAIDYLEQPSELTAPTTSVAPAAPAPAPAVVLPEPASAASYDAAEDADALAATADALGIPPGSATPDDVAALALGAAFVLSSAATSSAVAAAADPAAAADLQDAASVAAAAADAAAAGLPATAALLLSSLTDQVDLALSTAPLPPGAAAGTTTSTSGTSPPEISPVDAQQQQQQQQQLFAQQAQEPILSSEPTPAFNSPRVNTNNTDTTNMAMTNSGTGTGTGAGADFRSALTGGGTRDGALAHTVSPAAPTHTPAGSPALAAAEWRDYSTLPRRYKHTVDGLRSLAAARLMEQHWDAARHLDVEVTWDVPPIYLQGREAMRVAVWLAKWAAAVELTPAMVKYAELDSKRTALEMYVTAAVSPHRPWWLPATWLLPKTLPLQATVKLRISKGAAADGSDDVVTCIDGAIHNAPKLPTLIRVLNAVALGYLPAATEPLWAPLVALFGDPSYRNRAEEHPSLLTRAADSAANAAARAADSAADAAARAAAGTAAAADRGAGAVSYGAERVAGDRGGVLGAVKGGVVAGVDAVKGAVQEAAGAVEGGVAAGAEYVKEGAEAARRAVKGGGGGR
ncbi:hypothetical protein HYH02_011573 [Chlamydomonas schloesseri]|uniref:Uncharacterized protein n=1 Tax=Chlamydomonas schloesseri TaxID=2026947 RepID=A0A835W0H0_9CHLO|nr:hypothetical protein HYH02_011573 [Chlamydomonas schloesseri]|eukprot:KAG2436062.1 hypothetical protein HYH02_011573 [Chlamydomonas schloesseri]